VRGEVARHLTLADGVGAVPGVGPARAALLERLGVASVGDLLRLVPRRYEDRRKLTSIGALVDGEFGSFVARVVSASPETTPRRRRRATASIRRCRR